MRFAALAIFPVLILRAQSPCTNTPAYSTCDLVFDLAKLNFISSAELRVFAAARKFLKQRGEQVSFVNLQPQIQEVFEIVKALPGVSVFGSIAEFDQYLATRQRKVLEGE